MVFLDADQVEALARTIDQRYATLIRLAAYTGCAPARSAPCGSDGSTSRPRA